MKKDQDIRVLSSIESEFSIKADFILTNRLLLQGLPLFVGIPFGLLEPFLLNCEYKQLSAKAVVLSPGQINQYLYVLLSGELTIHIESLDSNQGFSVLPGEFVGEVSIIDGLLPTAYVAASQPSLLLCIHENTLWTNFFPLPGAPRNLFRQLAERMRSRNAAIQKVLERTLRLEYIEKELSFAEELQVSMLPHKPFFPGYPQVDVDALMQPAKEVGGDFYDAFPLDTDRICIAIGDVAGKGVPAALFMVKALTVFRTEMLKTKDLLQTIHAINQNLSEDNPINMFVTLMICVVDTRTSLLQFINGGHNRPVFGNIKDGFDFLTAPKGILVGIESNAEYQLATHRLVPGDILVFYTDGITEAINPAQEEFSKHRLLAAANQVTEASAKGIITTIRDAVFNFSGTAEQYDDLTLLAMHYLG